MMETQREISRSCKECGGLLVGRIDQVYCSEMCRTSANNKRVREEAQRVPDCIQRIQKTLLQNYKILNGLRDRGSKLFSKLYLMDLGFNFHHVTGITEKDGTILFYCFNQGYALHNDQVILLAETDF
ncbi:MAG: hypothetical protein JWR50_4143 [Mucilaginibacter sp.]|nr:hypothetical protein [Mucilaginibacter sp.]